LFVGRDSLGGLWGTVTGDRGGAPLHFVVAWVVEHLGGGLTALRATSALFAVASVPVLAALSARLAGRRVAIVATVLASGSWLLLFYGVYGRMYSLFLLVSALSYLALLRAVERGSTRRWAIWGLAVLGTIATHPYAVFVLASEGTYVLARARTKIALSTLGVVTVAATPFWYADLVLAGRFDVGVGGGGERLGGPLSIFEYLWQTAGDASSGYALVLVPVLGLAAYGWWQLRRIRPDAALLVLLVVLLPTIGFLLARLGESASPETRHLVYALPFFSTVVAAGIVSLLRRPVPIAGAVAVLLVAELAWAWHRTPPLFEGEPKARIEARRDASTWLAATARKNDVLFGYHPLFLGAWEHDRDFPRTVVPRADAKLALKTLTSATKPLGRGVWILDTGHSAGLPAGGVPNRPPRPESAFEALRFGPYIVIRTRRPTETPRRYLQLAAGVMNLGQELRIVDAFVNLTTIQRAAERERSRSTVSR
jgi:mannosyltransferase